MTITGGQKKDITKVVHESFTGIKTEDNVSENTFNTTDNN